ncbi:NifU family protein [Zoogloea dura]|jgi:Fe/S biogenesis protein NfuA|nr:NifU family protein [Zoogloea dura]
MSHPLHAAITLEPAALDYLRPIVAKQPAGCLGVRVYVLHPGTSLAHAGLGYAREGEHPDEVPMDVAGLQVFYNPAHVDFLRDLRVSCQKTETGQRLKLVAPHIKESIAPPADAPLERRISHFLETDINPQLAEHQGSIVLHAVENGDTALLKFGGSCHGCGSADLTLTEFISVRLRQHFPEIAEVRALAHTHA